MTAALLKDEDPFHRTIASVSATVQQLTQHGVSEKPQETKERPTSESLFRKMVANKLHSLPES